MATSKYWKLPSGSYIRASGKNIVIHCKNEKQQARIFHKIRA
jgi:hypothetical protein